jgi:hypothetical protein
VRGTSIPKLSNYRRLYLAVLAVVSLAVACVNASHAAAGAKGHRTHGGAVSYSSLLIHGEDGDGKTGLPGGKITMHVARTGHWRMRVKSVSITASMDCYVYNPSSPEAAATYYEGHGSWGTNQDKTVAFTVPPGEVNGGREARLKLGQPGNYVEIVFGEEAHSSAVGVSVLIDNFLDNGSNEQTLCTSPLSAKKPMLLPL